MTTRTSASISGIGLITGLPVTIQIEQAPVGSGIQFQLDETVIPASPAYVVNADRGVTLGKDGKTLSIVEHFLSACAMVGAFDLHVRVEGGPELPLLDGSSQPWVALLQQELGFSPAQPQQPRYVLTQAVSYQHPTRPEIQLWALPSAQLQISYLVNFPHPDLANRWFSWQPSHGELINQIAPARTFGAVSELPILQAQGLAKGVSLENTLGLTDEGGYTSPLRFEHEPIRHKILDLIGDLMLCGIPITQLQAHIVVFWGGHAAHLEFGKILYNAL